MDRLRFEDYVWQINHAETASDFSRLFLRYVSGFGIQRFMMGELSHPSIEQKEARLALMVNYPREWLDRYLERHYVEADPVYQRGLRPGPAFQWSDLRLGPRGSRSRQVMDEAAEFGLRSGVAVSLCLPRGRILGVGLSSAEPQIQADPLALSLMTAAFHHLASAFLAMVNPAEPPPPALSPREREILLWIAAGRSKVDVAHFLRLSEACVKRHCENIARKLGTSTLAASVAQAIRWGWIDPF